MLRLTCNNLLKNIIPRSEFLKPNYRYPLVISKAGYPSKMPRDHGETDDEWDDRMECFFSRCDIDHWELRQGLNNLAGTDAVPEPRIIIAALYACRRLNDYSATTRMLEMIKMKCGHQEKVIWPYIVQEIQPALNELGVLTPEEMGYDEPELALVDVHEVNL